MKNNSLAIYFTERFPFFGVLFIVLTIIFATASLYQQPPGIELTAKTAIVALSFAALLLRMRIADEFKDKHHDDINFPDRPLQRQLVSAQQLIAIGVLAFAIEITTVWIVGGVNSLLWYVPVLFYSWLMLREFYSGQWLEKHFTLYFILHELLFVFYGLWLVQVIGIPLNSHSIAWIVYFVGLVISIEIGRKFSIRRTPKGKIVQDTYTAVWGREATVTTLGLVYMTMGIALSYAESSLVFALISAVVTCILYGIKRHDKPIKLLIIIHSVTLVVVGIII